MSKNKKVSKVVAAKNVKGKPVVKGKPKVEAKVATKKK